LTTIKRYPQLGPGVLRARLDICGRKILTTSLNTSRREIVGATSAKVPEIAIAGDVLADARTGKNGRLALTGLFRQSVFGRLPDTRM
jgi:hypothetical protein